MNKYAEAYLLHGKIPAHKVYCAPRAEPLPGQQATRAQHALPGK